MLKIEVQFNNNLYEVNFRIINKEKPSPIERVFKYIVSISLEKCEGNLQASIDLINKNNFNVMVDEIKVKD